MFRLISGAYALANCQHAQCGVVVHEIIDVTPTGHQQLAPRGGDE
jgi:hypothetical protein